MKTTETRVKQNPTSTDVLPYRPDLIEPKWQARWAERHTNEPDLDRAQRPFFNLMMFPYPSAEGLHVGNMFAFTGADVYGRFKRLQGYDVFEPIGYDAFGIHSENYAIKLGINPAELIPRNIANFRRQLKSIGGMFDWRHELSTTDPAYYKWTQWLFLQLLKAGKAYKKAAAVNWCPKDQTVLANEQVIDGRCERCGSVVEQRTLEQWFFRITDYADRLLADLDDKTKMDWSESTTSAQRNWLGRSEGAEIVFSGAAGQRGSGPDIRVFTTRPDTLFGATFMVLAPEHPLVDAFTTADRKAEVNVYRQAAMSKDLVSRKVGERDKTGVFTGGHAINPATGKPIPVWIADYVLMEYGTGAIMAVPGHDQRDFEFAQKFGLDIVRVVADPVAQSSRPEREPAPSQRARGIGPADVGALEAAYTDNENGILVNSGQFDGLTVPDAKRAITAWLAERGAGKATINYRLHDWTISRQRYWGPPIPVIYCEDHGAVPVPEKDLPVLLPLIEDFQPDNSGISPLARHEEWYYVPCPVCGKRSRRETDVSDTFLDSSWYYLRYPSTEFDDRPFDPVRTKKWLPVTSYIGGNEHAVLHLLYSRFITMVLHELGHLHFDEPFRKFRAHGTIVKDGAKMSKSRGNVVIPDEYIARWGADTFRMYLMFLGPFQEGGDFRDEGISGPRRFLDKVWNLVTETVTGDNGGRSRLPTPDSGTLSHAVQTKRHQTVKKVTEGLEELRYNTSIAALMELVNTLRAENSWNRRLIEELIVMLAPFAPHFAEENWERLGHQDSIFDAAWPGWDERLTVEDSVEIAVQVNGKTRSIVQVPRGADEETVVAAALREAAVQRIVEDKVIQKRIYVPNRLLNLVVGVEATMSAKERLFEIGAAALTRLDPSIVGLYACPICARLLPREAIHSGDLTLEHVPPASVGGKGMVLTCRGCNSTAGHTVDAAMHSRERFLDLGRVISGHGGEFEGPVTITIDGVLTNAHLVFRDGTFTIEVREGVNNPKHFKGQMEALKVLKQQKPAEAVDLSLNAKVKFRFDRARVSDLRSAFLAAFAQFGYRYAFHRRLTLVREQILRPDEPLIDGAWWIAGPEFSDDPMMMVLISPFPAVLVRLRSTLVVLPWLNGPDDLYPAVRRHFANGPAPLTYDILEWPTTMVMLLDLQGQPVNPKVS